MPAPHDPPEAAELLEAVREFLIEQVEPQLEGQLRWHAKVAANVLAIVGRELALGPGHAERHAQRLARLGFRDDFELSAALRAGALDARLDDVADELEQMVADKLAVARPGHEQATARPG